MTGLLGWRRARLDELCDINPPKPRLAGVDDTTSVMFVPMASVDETTGTVAHLEESHIGAVGRKSYRAFTSGDILFAKITPCMENGKAAIVPPIQSGYGFGSTEFHVLRPKQGTDARLIWHLIRRRSFRDEAAEHFTGSVGQLRVPPDFLRSYETLLPESVVAQGQLADLLDTVTDSAANAMAHCRTAYHAIQGFRQAVLAAACSGRLTADWREANPDTTGILPGEPVCKRRGRSSGDPPLDLELPELPDSYALSTMGSIAVVLEYGTSQKSDASGAIPVLRMGNIQDGRLVLDDLKYCERHLKLERLMLHDGDLLFNRTNSPELVGKAAVFHESVPMTFASYLLRVQFVPEVADPDFVNYWINSAWGRMWARHVKTDGVSQSNINATKLGAMPIPLPPIGEQHEIVRRASELLGTADSMLKRFDAVARTIQRSSQAVLDKAFRGDLTPSEGSSG